MLSPHSHEIASSKTAGDCDTVSWYFSSIVILFCSAAFSRAKNQQNNGLREAGRGETTRVNRTDNKEFMVNRLHYNIIVHYRALALRPVDSLLGNIIL